MTWLKRRPLGLILALVLAMLTSAGASACVLACVHRCLPAVETPAAPHATCPLTRQPEPCCCGAAARLDPACSNAALGHRCQCGCSLEAPSVPPSGVLEPANTGFRVDRAATLPWAFALDRGRAEAWTLPSPSSGAPRAPYLRSSPSRAPPARRLDA